MTKKWFVFLYLLICFNGIWITRTSVPEKHMVVVVPSYNNKKWYTWNLDSILNQTYTNFHVIYIDDASEDGTGQLVQDYIQEHDVEQRTLVIKNKWRRKALANLYTAVHMCAPDDIIVILDGDDRFAHHDVLKIINQVYADPTVWITHSRMKEYPSGTVYFWIKPFPEEVIGKNTFREYNYIARPLRTFYARLFHHIAYQDLLYNGQFFPMTYDLAIMFPMLEMARNGHIKFIDQVLYEYNSQNPMCDHKISRSVQHELELVIRSRKKYPALGDAKNIAVIIASYNNEKWYEKNLSSVFEQDYTNFHVFYIDDCSTDGTLDLVEKYVAKHDLQDTITIIHNTQRKGALANHYEVIQLCADDTIIVILDGDDWFAHNHVLTCINKVYQNPNIWLTFGQFKICPDNYFGFCKAYTDETIRRNAFRAVQHSPSHLRTFYAGLFKKIHKHDLLYNGDFFKVACDDAAMLPMIEMAGSHHAFISEVLLVYNNKNNLNVHKLSRKNQLAMDRVIRSRKKYEPLKDLF